MWSSKILNSSYTNGVLIVTMEYTDGNSTFSEPIDMTGGDEKTLHRKVQSRLDTLEATAALNAKIASGPFVPVIPPQSPETTLRVAVRHLEAVKKASDLGLLTPAVAPATMTTIMTPSSDAPVATDPVAEATAAAQAVFDPSLVDSIN